VRRTERGAPLLFVKLADVAADKLPLAGLDLSGMSNGRGVDKGHEEQAQDHSDEQGVEATDDSVTHDSSVRATYPRQREFRVWDN
jgi:hypothetical protein